jgi:type VI secretion system protein ImpA
MPLREDILDPIAGENPGGADIRYDFELSLYDKIKEARRQDDDLAQGEWRIDRKVADFGLVINLAQEGLATKSKDLQLAAWLTEGLLHSEGFSGLRQGLLLCHGLVARFWDSLYPPIEDGERELRAAPLDWLVTSLDIPLKSAPLVRAGYDWFKFKECRLVGYEEQAQTDSEKKHRAKMLAEGKLAPEAFDKAFADTPKAFYLQSEKDLDACLDALRSLDELCREKFGDAAPSFGKLKIALEEVRHTVHSLLERKRETEPDPVEERPAVEAGEPNMAADAVAARVAGAGGATAIIIPVANSEPPGRREAIAAVAQAAAFLRNREPHSPAPYLMMRGLRWGELRATSQFPDAHLLEAPPTELRQHIKRLALSNKWNELLETAESAMSLPCSRAWLDLQRFVVAACTALGSEYEPIAAAIRSELRTLLNDVPQLLDTNLLDDTPTANAETRAWLKELTEAPRATSESQEEGVERAPVDHNPLPSWLEKAADPYVLAQEAVKAGQADKAFEVMRKEIVRQRSGRGRFQRTMQLVQICVEAGSDAIAQPLIDDLAAAIETHKLDDWEDNEVVAAALSTVMKVSKKVQGNPSEREKLFERICRLDPVRALRAG